MSTSSRDPRDRSQRAGSVSSMASSATGRSSAKGSTAKTHMESAVTKILVATRHLLEDLTNWAEGKVTETEVSDSYVRLGNDFNKAVVAFSDLNVPMGDLLAIPSQLRVCLERCLAEDPSPANLQLFLPEIKRTIVTLLQGLQKKQTDYKTFKEEERREADELRILEREKAEREREREMERERQRERERERERHREREREKEASWSRDAEREREAARERERMGGRSGSVASTRSTSHHQPTEDGRWIPPSSRNNSGSSSSQYQQSTRPSHLPVHQPSSSSSRDRDTPSPIPSHRIASASSASSPVTLSPAINLVSTSSSFPPNNNASPNPAPSNSQERPYSTASNSTIDSTASSSHYSSSGASIPRRHGISSRHGQPLPTPPPDAFRPARRPARASPVDGSGPSERGDSMLGEEILSSRGGARSPDGGRKSPTPSHGSRQASSSSTTSASNQPGGRSPLPNVVRHSLVDSPVPPSQHPSSVPSPSPHPRPRSPVRQQENDRTLPPIPPIISETPSSPPFSSHFAFATPTVTAPSPPPPNAPSKSTLSPSPASTSLAPSPSFSGLPLDPSQSSRLPDTAPAPSVADQTLSTLRKSEHNISRRASQRYSTYQIGKIMDNGGLGASTGGKKSSDGKRGSDSLGGSGVGSDGKMSSSPSRPARSARAVPPVPSLPAGVAASPLRNGGFVPPSRDTGVELGSSTSGAATASGGDPDESFTSWGTGGGSSSSHSTSTLKPPSTPPKISPHHRLATAPNLSTPLEDTAEFPPTSPESLTLFLLHGRECKRCVVPPNPTVSSLRMLFMEKFGFSPGTEEFPSIYVRDPKTEWRYEWEEEEELRDGVQLSLNIEPLDQIKVHIDDQITGLSRKLEDLIRDSVAPLSTQFATLQAATAARAIPSAPSSISFSPNGGRKMSLRGAGFPPGLSPGSRSASTSRLSLGLTTNEEVSPMAKMLVQQPTGEQSSDPNPPISSTEPPISSSSSSVSSTTTVHPASSVSFPTSQPPQQPPHLPSAISAHLIDTLRSQFDEVQTLRRDLGVMRQVYADGMNTVSSTFTRIRKENQRLRDVASRSLGGGRAFVEEGKVKIDLQSQDALRKVEDLADVVEELHLDVTEKMVVPKPSVMRGLRKGVAEAQVMLEDLVKTTAAAATTWRTTWSQEMENVMAEEKQLNHHLAFTVDIQADFKALKDVFDQIELYAAHRASMSASSSTTTTTTNSVNLANGASSLRKGGSFRPPMPDGSEPSENLSSVLFEIKGATIDPTKRLKAIEQAQKMRERELAEAREGGNELASQLSEFVEGRKLKKTGGVEEAERVRQRKNELALRNGLGGGPAGSVPVSRSGSGSGSGNTSAGGKGSAAGSSPKIAAAAPLSTTVGGDTSTG